MTSYAAIDVCPLRLIDDQVAMLASWDGQRGALIDETEEGTRWRFVSREGAAQEPIKLGGRVYTAAFARRVDRLFVGLWSGMVLACSERGFEWRVGVRGVVSTLASTAEGGRVLAGTWGGEVHVLDGAGGTVARLDMRDAVIAGVVEPTGRFGVVALADGTLARIGLDGRIIWRLTRDRPAMGLAASRRQVTVVHRDGVVVRLDSETGEERSVWRAGRSLSHCALSADGSTVAVIDASRRLHYQVGGSQRWSTPLTGSPRHLTVWGMGEAALACVFTDSGAITFNRYQRERPFDLPRATRLAVSGDGTRLLVADGEALAWREVAVAIEQLEPPEIELAVSARKLTQGQVGVLEVSLANVGEQTARDIRLAVDEEAVTCRWRAVPPTLEGGAKETVVGALEASKAGDIPLEVRLTYRDAAGAPHEVKASLRLEIDAPAHIRLS